MLIYFHLLDLSKDSK